MYTTDNCYQVDIRRTRNHLKNNKINKRIKNTTDKLTIRLFDFSYFPYEKTRMISLAV